MTAFVYFIGLDAKAIAGLEPVLVHWGSERVEEERPRHRFGGVELCEVEWGGARCLDVSQHIVVPWHAGRLPAELAFDLRALVAAASTAGRRGGASTSTTRRAVVAWRRAPRPRTSSR